MDWNVAVSASLAVRCHYLRYEKVVFGAESVVAPLFHNIINQPLL